MNFNKTLLFGLAFLGLTTLIANARSQNPVSNILRPVGELVTFPFKAGSKLIRKVVLPIVEFPVTVISNSFANTK